MENIDIINCVLHVGRFIEMSDQSHEENHKKNQRIELLNQNKICYLKEGKVIVYRQEDDLITMTLNAPMIIGLTQMHNSIKYHYLRCETDCKLIIIDNNDATKLFDTTNIWSYAFNILTWHINLYFQRDVMMINHDIRNVIIKHIKHIWSLAPNIRNNISVYSFIINRNHISRSVIHKVIQEMSRAGKIKIERGKVVFYDEC